MSIAKYKRVLITGGAGFVGSNLAVMLKKDLPTTEVICLDNLKRRGSELALRRLKAAGVEFVHGDIRNREDLEVPRIDLLIECAAEPSVLAGINSSPDYLVNTNMVGTLNCLELARKDDADVVFLSTSRVYPMAHINNLQYEEEETRFQLKPGQLLSGSSEHGIAEQFPLDKPRSLYGATKLMSEIIIGEYIDTYQLRAIINRCGVITGPWQMGKVDQGVFVLWVAKHYFKKELSYIGYGGTGKQVRDFIHIHDLYRAIKHQMDNFSEYSGEVYNVGGGLENSVSLQELTKLCQEITGNKIKIQPVIDERPADLISFVTDSRKFKERSGLTWEKGPRETVKDIFNWIKENEDDLRPILG